MQPVLQEEVSRTMLFLSCQYKISALERRKTSSTSSCHLCEVVLWQSTLEVTLEFFSNGTNHVVGVFDLLFQPVH